MDEARPSYVHERNSTNASITFSSSVIVILISNATEKWPAVVWVVARVRVGVKSKGLFTTNVRRFVQVFVRLD
jgi:hypothetical protein